MSKNVETKIAKKITLPKNLQREIIKFFIHSSTQRQSAVGKKEKQKLVGIQNKEC